VKHPEDEQGARLLPSNGRLVILVCLAGVGSFPTSYSAPAPLPRTEVDRRAAYIKKHPDYTSYRVLLELRREHPRAYRRLSPDVRAAVLCSALKEQPYFDDWPEPYEPCEEEGDLESEQALVEIGRPAVPHLLPLLDDRSPAEWEEIEEPPEYDDYRRADYAFRYISWIMGLPFKFEPRPEDRDRAIEALKNKLRGEKKPGK
jgi:hypothetical protein